MGILCVYVNTIQRHYIKRLILILILSEYFIITAAVQKKNNINVNGY